MTKKTLCNFFSLPIGIIISIGLAWLLIKLFPSQSSEGWTGVGDMLASAVIVPAFSILTFLIWTIKVAFDINKLKSNKKIDLTYFAIRKKFGILWKSSRKCVLTEKLLMRKVTLLLLYIICNVHNNYAQADYVYKVKRIDHVLPRLTLKITRVYQGENHGKIAIDFVHNAKDDSLNKKKFGKTDFYNYLSLVVTTNKGGTYILDNFQLENILYDKQPLPYASDTIQLTFKHVSYGLGFYEYYYEPIIFCSKKDVFFSNNFELKQDYNWREVGKVYKKPFVFADYVDQDPLYHLNKYYLNRETGKIYKGSKLLRKFKAKTLFHNRSSFVVINEMRMYTSKDGKQKMKGSDLIQLKKIDLKLWNLEK